MRPTVLLSTLIFFVAAAAGAQWVQTNGPEGGSFGAIAADDSVIVAALGGSIMNYDGAEWRRVGELQLRRLEIVNAFQSGIRRGRIDAAYRDTSLNGLRRLPITIDADCDIHVWTATLGLADRYKLIIYDACYLELAQRRNLPLATLDRELRLAGEALGISLRGI